MASLNNTARPGKFMPIAFLLLVSLLSSNGWAQQVFYAIGSENYIAPDPAHPWRFPYSDVRLYAVDSATLRVIRSLSVETKTPGYGPGFTIMSTGMLTSKRDVIVLSDEPIGGSTVMRVSAPDLAVESRMEIGKLYSIDCLENTFVHPLTGLVYFSCDFGRHGEGFAIVNTVKKSIVADLPDGPPLPRGWPPLGADRPQFAYEPVSHELFLVGPDAIALDPENRPVAYVRAKDVAQAAGFDTRLRGPQFGKLTALLNGQLVFLMHSGQAPALALYDPKTHRVLHTWQETELVVNQQSYADPKTGHVFDKPVQQVAKLSCGPVSSRDGSRLFAMSEGDVVVWDSATLQELNRFDAPEWPPPGTENCFVAAPGGKGMWFYGVSDKLYRLDDHTGELLGEVKLPFHLISLIL
jgi:hypothetical protein